MGFNSGFKGLTEGVVHYWP